MVWIAGSASTRRAPVSTASRALPLFCKTPQALLLAANPNFQVETTRGFVCPGAEFENGLCGCIANDPAPNVVNWINFLLVGILGISFHFPYQCTCSQDGGIILI